MALFTRALDPNNLRPLFDALSVAGDVLEDLREDGAFVRTARRTLFPLPTDTAPALPTDPFAPAHDDHLALDQRFAVVGSGGSGATAAMVGLQRAFEEAGVSPVALSAASGAVLFALPWAAGLTASEVAKHWLSIPRDRYLDIDWKALLRSSARAFGGWAGLVKGEALEEAMRALVGDLTLGQTRIPVSFPAWNIDQNRVEIFGSRTTPELPLARAARVAIAIPIFVEPVKVGAHLYGDGGVVNIFPLRPVLEAHPDVIVGLNSYLPENFVGQDVTGWRQRSFAIVRVSGQLRWSGMVALAREQALLAGDKLELLHPVPYDEVRGARFYETFVDRSKWPRFMRAGQEAGRTLLARLAQPPLLKRAVR